MFNKETQVKMEKKMWSVKEDVALMKSWCLVSEDNRCGRKKKGGSLWAKVHNLYHEAQKENPNEISERNVDSIKGRWKRLDENGIKWIAAYKEAYGRKTSEMSPKDVEKEAHAIYEVKGKKFQDWLVFNEVMSKHPKWVIKLDHDSTRSRAENEENEKGMSKHPKWDLRLDHDSRHSCAKNEENEKSNEENGGSSKRSRINEDGECSIPFNPEIPSSRCSTIPRPEDGDKVKNKENVKTSQPSSNNEVATEIRALRLTRDNEVELMMKLESARIELEREKEKRKILKMNQVMLNTLLAKDHLSPEDEEMKRHLMAIVLKQ